MKPCVQIACPDVQEIKINEVREFFWVQTESGPVGVLLEERLPLDAYVPPWERS